MITHTGRTQMARAHGAALGTLLGIVVALVLVAAGTYFFYCPCERTPGGWLLGNEVSEPIADWSFANEVPLCQIQVSAGLPHSVNLNCMAADGEMFLSCSRCDGKRWSTAAVNDPEGRIRVGDNVYPITLQRVVDAPTLDRAWTARGAKTGNGVGVPRPDHWWSFQVRSRGQATPR